MAQRYGWKYKGSKIKNVYPVLVPDDIDAIAVCYDYMLCKFLCLMVSTTKQDYYPVLKKGTKYPQTYSDMGEWEEELSKYPKLKKYYTETSFDNDMTDSSTRLKNIMTPIKDLN